MKALFAPLSELGGFQEIRSRLRTNQGLVLVTGCIDSQKAHFIAGLGEGMPVRVIVAPNDLRAKEIYENYRVFDRNALLFPAKDFIFFQADVHSNLLEQQRIGVWKALAEGRDFTVITTMAAFMSRQMPFTAWKEAVTRIAPGDTLDIEYWKQRLVELGYERTAQVEGPGQFAVRGGIIDIFGLSEENPVRIELWGDEIDMIRSFDVLSQRSIENLQEFTVYPASELILEEKVRKEGLEKIRKEAKRRSEKLRKDMKTPNPLLCRAI